MPALGAVQQTFTYLLYDLVTNVKLAEIPFADVMFSGILNGTGTFSASLNLASPKVKGALSNYGGSTNSPLQPARTAIYVDLNGELVWGGILWTVAYDGATQIATVAGQDFWSYFQSRRINWNATYSGVDQFAIFRSLIDTAQSEPGGNIGINTGSATCGVRVSIAWDSSQLIAINQAVTSLTQQTGTRGFDFAIDVAYDFSSGVGVPAKYLTLSYPRRGRSAGRNGLLFDSGSAWADGYKWPADGAGMANVLYGIGAGSGPATAANGGGLRSAQAYTPAITAGYPLLEGSMNRSDITDQATLDNLTITRLAAVSFPIVLPSMVFDLAMPDPQFGSYVVGDDAEVRIPPDEWFPAGHDEYWRVAGYQVKPGNEGVGTVALSFTAPPLIF